MPLSHRVSKNSLLRLSLAYRRADKPLRKQLQENSILVSEVIEFAVMDNQLSAIEMGLEDPRVLCAHHGEEEYLWFEKQLATSGLAGQLFLQERSRLIKTVIPGSM